MAWSKYHAGTQITSPFLPHLLTSGYGTSRRFAATHHLRSLLEACGDAKLVRRTNRALHARYRWKGRRQTGIGEGQRHCPRASLFTRSSTSSISVKKRRPPSISYGGSSNNWI